MSRSFWVEALGCPKNQVDSDKLTGTMLRDGLVPAGAPEDADLVVVNTCAFIDEARRESIDVILAMSDLRSDGAELVVTGCMAERYAGELADGGYIVQDGSIRLEPGTFSDGNEVVVGPGTLIGELALLTDMVCQATAIAKEPATVIRISRSLFRKMLEGYPEAADILRDQIAARARHAVAEMTDVRAMLDTSPAPR